MVTDQFLFGIALLAAEIAIAYSALYIVFYKIFRLHKKTGDSFLAWILLIIAFIISLISFPYCADYILERFF